MVHSTQQQMSKLHLCYMDVNKGHRHTYTITTKFIASLRKIPKNTKTQFYAIKFVIFKHCSLLRHRKFSLLHKFVFPNFSARYDILFHLNLYITDCLCSLGSNIRSGTAKYMEGSVQMFVLLHYDK